MRYGYVPSVSQSENTEENRMLSWTHIIVVVAVVVLLFGRGKVSDLMGDVAKGIKSFKKGLADDDEPAKAEPRVLAEPRVIEGSAASDASMHSKDKTTANG